MMAKGPKRRFILGVLMAACLLFCILCLNPEEVRKHFHGFIQDTSSSFQVFQEYQKPMNNRTSDLKVPSETPVHPNPTKQEPTEDKALNVTQPTSKSTNVIVNPGPTEPAYIGDTYMSEDSVPLTNCLNSLHSKVSQTDFGDRFLKDIPVLQWAKHVSPEQYQRLRQYPGAHGWAVIDYNSLLESLSALNSSANRQMFDDWSSRGNQSGCIRCAVVGNGGILKGSKKGAEIDSHHYVFRTNGAVIQGFEKDVGSRTTHYTFSVNTLMNSLRSYAKVGYRRPPLSKETRYIFLPDHDRDYLMMKAAAMHVRTRWRSRCQHHGQLPGTSFRQRLISCFHRHHVTEPRDCGRG